MPTITPNPDLPPSVQFRSLKPVDRHEVEELTARRVGFGIHNTLDLVFDDEAPVFGYAATKAESVIGYGVVMILESDGIEHFLSISSQDVCVGERNAYLHQLMVEEDWEGRGIGSELTRIRLAIARDAVDLDAAFGRSWLREDTVDSSVVFEKFGFRRVKTIQNGYSKDRDCPDCAPDNCTCSSAVYAKEF